MKKYIGVTNLSELLNINLDNKVLNFIKNFELYHDKESDMLKQHIKTLKNKPF